MKRLSRLDKSIKVLLGVLIANALIVGVLFVVVGPSYRGQFVTEGKAMQMLQVSLYLIGSLTGLAIFIKKKLWRYRLGYLGVPLLALVCMLEEISWGYHLFSLYKPPEFMGIRIDSLHDFVQIGTVILRDIGSTTLGALAVAVLVLLAAGAILYAIFKYWMKFSPIIWLIVVFVLCVMGSSVFDFNEPSTLITDFFEELCDESAAISLLFANFMLWFVKPPEAGATSTEAETTEALQDV